MRELSQSVYVSLAHRYWNDGWDPARNREVYGRQASPTGVGANLRLELSCADERDLGPGVANLKRLVDHRALFEDIPEFSEHASTLERVTEFLAARHGAASWRALTVHEDDGLSCVVTADGRLTVRERVYNLSVECAGRPDADSGVLLPRGTVARAVRRVAPAFADPAPGSRADFAGRLLRALRGEVPCVTALEVALNPRESVRVFDQNEGDLHA